MGQEIKTVAAQVVDYKCPACNTGYMRPNGIIKLGTPNIYGHKCTNCNHTMDFLVKYPLNA